MSRRQHPRRARAGRATVAAVAVTLVAALAGCTGGEEEQAGGQPGTPSATQGAGSSTTPPTTAAAPATTTAPAAPAPQEEVLASRDGSIDGDPIKADILELRRTGGTVALSVRFSYTGQEDNASAQIGQDLSNGVNDKQADGSGDPFTFDGPSLIDGQNSKRHLVARDSTNACVCDSGLSSKFVKPDAPVILSAVFGAPPSDVTKMGVQIPQFGTFADVPLS